MFSDVGGSDLSGDAALDWSLRFSTILDAIGIKQGEVVAFLCLSSSRHAATWFGTMIAGRVASNLHIRGEAPERLAETLRWLGASVLIYDAALADLAAEAAALAGSIKRLCLDHSDGSEHDLEALVTAAERADYAAQRPDADALAAIVLSSGSTGRPKGIMHSQQSLLESSLGGQNVLECPAPGDRLLAVMNPSFAAWPLFVLAALGGKATTVFMQRFDAKAALEAVEGHRISILPLIPTMWRMIRQADPGKFNLGSVRLAAVGGESPSPDDVQWLRANICERVVGTYLTAETGMGSAAVVRTEDLVIPEAIGSAGLPTVGADIRVIVPHDEVLSDLPAGELGEIAISGPSLGLGYWREPALTAAKFVDGWWRSGDAGRLDARGYLWVEGRLDNVINTGGIKVYSEEVENAISGHEAVQNCAVVGRPDPTFGQRIEAFVVSARGNLEAGELERFLRHDVRLSGFKIPKVFHFVDRLPLGATGKIDRRALRQEASS